MIRGSDLWETEIAYPIIWDALGWDTSQLPTFLYWPRLFFEDFAIPYTDVETGLPAKLRAIGTSKMARLIANQPEFNGNWCHSSFPTVCSYMERGYPASYLRDFWLGDVWGRTFPYFNGEEMRIGDIIYKPLTYEMGFGEIEMRGFNKKVGTYQHEQARVPYPLTSDGLMRHTPTADIITPTLLPITA